MGKARRRGHAPEPDRAIEPVRHLRVAAQYDARIMVAGEGEHVLHQLPANTLSSAVAPHIKPAQTTAAPGLTIDAADRHEPPSFENAKKRLPGLRKPVRSRQPLILRPPDKAKTLPLALGEQLLDRRRPLMDLADRAHTPVERLNR